MPKKAGKKGKKGKKGGKKGKKSAAKDASIKTMAENNAAIWQARLEVAEQSRVDHREHARRLALENETLQNEVLQTEKDTIDVIGYLKRQDEEKDIQMEKLRSEMQRIQQEHAKEKETIVTDFQTKVDELEETLAQKMREVEMIQAELKLVKDFRRKRVQIQRELEEVKETMLLANQEHKETLAKLEERFFEEKMKLQQEANHKIAELADKAHTQAVANLDDTTKSVYKENVLLTKSLAYHKEEAEQLKKLREKLERENLDFRAEKELNDLLVHKKVSEAKQHKQLIKELQERVSTLEKSLNHVVREFESEQKSVTEKSRIENESSLVEITKLQRTIDLRTKEMNRVKRLARNILDQRTEVEQFFLESLEYVKKEITANRLQYRRDAEAAYQKKLLDAYTGKGEFPKIRTFNKYDTSTNSVFQDLEAAEQMMHISDKVDISDLTWENKEKVLRYLFAKINRTAKTVRQKHSAPPSLVDSDHSLPRLMEKEAWSNDDQSSNAPDRTFLTQADVTDSQLPDIGSIHLPDIGSIHLPVSPLTTNEPIIAA